jgi:O-antigen/teichoic acid export membrane protein
MALPDTHEVPLEAHEVHDLAARGLAALGFRSLSIRVMSLAANVLLARMLTPRDFGLMAFGLTIIGLGSFITDGGLGAAILRQGTIPTNRQLEALFGAQLVVASAAAALIVAIALPLGTLGTVAAIMALALPIDCVRMPASLSVERRLNYTPIVRSEISEMVAYYIVAVGLVALGAGVWGLAIAVPVRALVGTIVLVKASGVLMRPRIDIPTIRPLYKFGLRMQAIGFVSVGRDQGVNFVTAAIAGPSVLGILSFGVRLMQPIWLLFEGSWRVSYPALSRLRDAGVDLADHSRRALAIATATTALGVVAVASCAPAAVPSLFGTQWNEAIPVVPLLLGNLLLAGPLLVCASGFFAAIGQPGIVVRGELWGAAVIFLLGVPLLLDGKGAVGLSVAMLVAALVGTGYMAAKLRPYHIHILPVLTKLSALAVASSTVGWLVAESLGPTIWSTLVAAIVGSSIYVGLLFTFQRSVGQDCLRLIRRMTPKRFGAVARRFAA